MGLNNFIAIYFGKISIIVMVLTFALTTIDVTLVRIYFFSNFQIPDENKIFIYYIIIGGILTGQFFIMKFIYDKTRETRRRNILYFSIIINISFLVQILLMAFLITISLEIHLENRYHTFIITSTLILSYSSAAFFMLVIGTKLLSLLKTGSNFLVLFYGMSVMCIALYLISTILYVAPFLYYQPQIVKPHFGYVTPHTTGLLFKNIQFLYSITSILAFVLMWISSSMIYHRYLRTLNWKYWVLLVFSLFYFIIQFTPIENEFLYLSQSDPLIFTLFSALIFMYSKPLGGLLFGLAFWLIVWNLRRNKINVDHLTIAAYGIVLLFICTQTIEIITEPFPPFGIASVTLVSLSSYMIFVGIYSSTISVSRDKEILAKVRKIIEERYNLLGIVAFSENKLETGKLAMKLYQKVDNSGYEETGIKSSLTPEEVKNYCEQVVEELRKVKSRK
jgi:hypothetical protein